MAGRLQHVAGAGFAMTQNPLTLGACCCLGLHVGLVEDGHFMHTIKPDRVVWRCQASVEMPNAQNVHAHMCLSLEAQRHPKVPKRPSQKILQSDLSSLQLYWSGMWNQILEQDTAWVRAKAEVWGSTLFVD